MQRVAAQDALHAQPTSFERTVTLDRLECVLRAAGREATLREHQMRQRHLVRADQSHGRAPRPATPTHVTRLTQAANSARRSAKEAAYGERFATTQRPTEDRLPRSSPRPTP